MAAKRSNTTAAWASSGILGPFIPWCGDELPFFLGIVGAIEDSSVEDGAFGGDILRHEGRIGPQPVSKIEQLGRLLGACRNDMDVQQIRLALGVDGSDPHRPRLWERVAIPLAPEPEREEHVIDMAEVGIVAVRNDEIEISLARTARHGATTDVLHCRSR